MPGAGKRRAKQARQQMSPGGGHDPPEEHQGEKQKPGPSAATIQGIRQLNLRDSDVLPPTKRLVRQGESYPQFPGSSGRRIQVKANHFPMTVKVPEGVVFMYSVVVKPPWSRDYRRRDRILYHQVVKEWKFKCPQIQDPFGVVFNGKDILYAARAFQAKDIEPLIITVPGETKDLEFSVSDVKMLKAIPINDDIHHWLQNGRSGDIPQDSIQALDLILSQAVTTDLNVETIGRSYFHTSGQVLDIGFGREVWIGNFSSVRPVKMGWKNGNCLSLNVDVSNKPALKELHLTDGNSYISQLLDARRGQSIDMKKGLQLHQVEILRKDIKGLKVRYELPNGHKRSYRVNDVVSPASEMMIPDLKKTVEKYFKDQYKVKMKYPKMPCLWLGPREKTIYIPVEFCRMEKQPQPRSKKLPEDATANMIKSTAVPPWEREKKIMEGLKKNNNILKDDPYAKKFGVSIAGEFATLNARVLKPPSIGYCKTQVEIKDSFPGSWRQGRRDQYVDGKVINSWAVLDLARLTTEQFNEMIDGFSKIGKEVGLRISRDRSKIWSDSCPVEEVSVHKKFEQLFADAKKHNMTVDMILIILPFKGSEVYNTIKQLGDIKYKIPTQCAVKNPLFKKDFKTGKESLNIQVVSNICLKMNAKLGGTNFILSNQCRPPFLDRPVMIMGADVTHPAPEHRGLKPSIAAVVASMDPRALSNYEVQVRVQSTEQNEEVIQDMKNIAVRMLKSFFRRNNGRKPERILMFRDGVSEGQFLTVLSRELRAIQAACRDLEDGYEPNITYLVVQKRHHTRIMPMGPTDRNQYSKNGNVLAGTVVDQGINHPTEGDFYLVSHEGIQGTSRPTHYQVLWDDSDFTADDLESLSYYLCHLYARCSRSVSYPTPTYYSHLAADRARKHVDELSGKRVRDEEIKNIIENLNEGEDKDKYNMYFV